MDWHSYYANGPDKRRRKAFPATCGLHRGPMGFANLLVSMQVGRLCSILMSRVPVCFALMRKTPGCCAIF
jgi:hypothetical protein